MKRQRPATSEMPDRLPTGTPHARTGGLPDREQLRTFIENATGCIGKREISREFGLGPEHRQALRQMLREMALDGTLAPAGARRFRVSDRLPESMVVQVTGTDADGDPIARPVQWDGEGAPPSCSCIPNCVAAPPWHRANAWSRACAAQVPADMKAARCAA